MRTLASLQPTIVVETTVVICHTSPADIRKAIKRGLVAVDEPSDLSAHKFTDIFRATNRASPRGGVEDVQRLAASLLKDLIVWPALKEI